MKIDSLPKTVFTAFANNPKEATPSSKVLFPDSFQRGKSQRENSWEAVKNFFISAWTFIWTFIKNHLLFCFFDIEKEEKSDLENEHKKFYDFYFQNSHDLKDESREKHIAQKYKKLSKDLKKVIEEEIEKFIVKQLPKTKDAKNMPEIVNNVLKKPFSTLQIGDTPSDSDPRIFEGALFDAGLRLNETEPDGDV